MPSGHMDPERASRLRDNKRRFRSRRKEYVADLERSLRELRQQGVQATKEVQLSARRVTRENVQLRGLLRHLGVNDNIVESWTQKDENSVNESTLCTRPQEGSAQITSSNSGEKKQDNTNSTCADKLPPPQPAIQTSDPREVESAAQCLASMISASYLPRKQRQRSSLARECISETSSTTQPESACISGTSPTTQYERSCMSGTSSTISPERTCISEIHPTIQPGRTCIAEALSATSTAPCKLITRLAANPGADITQIPIATDRMDRSDEADGVECSKAYQMLMQFATTEDKLDTVAHALENGCVANKGPGGGCKVPNKVVWEMLDDIQS